MLGAGRELRIEADACGRAGETPHGLEPNQRWRMGLAPGKPRFGETARKPAAFPATAVPTM